MLDERGCWTDSSFWTTPSRSCRHTASVRGAEKNPSSFFSLFNRYFIFAVVPLIRKISSEKKERTASHVLSQLWIVALRFFLVSA